MVPTFAPRKEKLKGPCSSFGKNKWEPGECLMLVSSSQQTKLLDLVSFLLWVQLSQGLGLGQSSPSAPCCSPAGSSQIILSLIILSGLGPNQTEQFKKTQRINPSTSEGLLLQPPKPGKGKKEFLPKLTKSKLSKQMKRAQSSWHHRHLALKQAAQEPQGSPCPGPTLRLLQLFLGIEQTIRDHHKITPGQQFQS